MRVSNSVTGDHILSDMTKLLDKALEAVRLLPPDDQDEIADHHAALGLGFAGACSPFPPEEGEAIARSKGAATRGEFATDEEVRAVWAKRGT